MSQMLTADQRTELCESVALEIKQLGRVTDARMVDETTVEAVVIYEPEGLMGEEVEPEWALMMRAEQVFNEVNQPTRLDYLIDRALPGLRPIGRGVIDSSPPRDPEVIDEEDGVGRVFFRIVPENVE